MSVPKLFHVSEGGPFTTMLPRPAPSGSAHDGQEVVWAVDDVHLPNYLVPRDCPRVCWATTCGYSASLASPAPRVIAIEYDWLPRLVEARLQVHELDPTGFTEVDAVAGYWVNPNDVQVRAVRRVDDCVAALAEAGIELRLTGALWWYADAVVETCTEFSIIRMHNAAPRP